MTMMRRALGFWLQFIIWWEHEKPVTIRTKRQVFCVTLVQFGRMFDNIGTINTFSVTLQRKTSMYTKGSYLELEHLLQHVQLFFHSTIIRHLSFWLTCETFALFHANRKVSSQIEKREEKTEFADSSVNAMFYFTYFESSNNKNWSSKLRFETLKSRFPVLWMFGKKKNLFNHMVFRTLSLTTQMKLFDLTQIYEELIFIAMENSWDVRNVESRNRYTAITPAIERSSFFLFVSCLAIMSESFL